MTRINKRMAASASIALAATLVLSACGADNEGDSGSEGGESSSETTDVSGTINGAGSSAQQAASEAWIANFSSVAPDATVNYDPVGSSGGREQFIDGGTDFAGSDALMDDEELAAAQKTCGGDIVEVPAYVSPIAIIFNLEGIDSLNLSPETIGGIFQGDITTWNDDAIAADNPDVDLPDTAITPVHRADGSGTTENFLDYLDQTSGGSWSGGVSDEWPIQGGEAGDGTSGVVSAVTEGDGAIGYADASQAGDLGTVSVGVGDEFVAYSPEAVATALDNSPRVEGRGDLSIAIEVERTTDDPSEYPVALVSYDYACATYPDQAQADLVKAYLGYVVSADGQEVAANDAGAAPLSSELSDEASAIVEQISAS